MDIHIKLNYFDSIHIFICVLFDMEIESMTQYYHTTTTPSNMDRSYNGFTLKDFECVTSLKKIGHNIN